jgi:hypothetical protein
MGFKFFKQDVPDEPAAAAVVPNQPGRLSVDNRPAVFLNLNRGRSTIDDNEWNFILEQQRRNLVEYMWDNGMIIQTIISQDMDGFSLRTEINF